MPIRKVRSDELEEYGGILISAALPAHEPARAPFTAHWCVVKPGATSDRHMHRETEAFFVTRGRGFVTVDGETADVRAGDTIYLEPLHHHTIHNPSDSAEDLIFITAYWADDAALPYRHRAERPARTPVLAFATPATPNGDLHLGHISGPYLAGDIWARYMRAQGVDARFVTGSDDHQTYVDQKARKLGMPAAEAAAMFAGRIRAALEAADMSTDLFIEPAVAPEYQQQTVDFFARLYESGKLRREVVASLYCPSCDRHLFEVYVRGRCPHCGSMTSGNGCEECGRPNECVDLVDPVCNLCDGTPEASTQERVVFPLEDYREELHDFVGRAHMGTRLRTLCERMLADSLPVVSVSHESDWGIPVPVEGLEGQVIWSWLEVAALYLHAGVKLEAERGRERDGDAFLAATDLDVVQFFGFDNGYFKAILLTALFLAIDPGARLPSTFVTNEFFRLEGRKFSTSANHLITVLDAIEDYSVDAIRFYLSWVRPERVETSFTESDFAATVQRELVEGWQVWLGEFDARLRDSFDRIAPDTGLWTDQHREFEALLRGFAERAEQHLFANSFSPPRLVRLLCELVREARAFGASEAHWGEVPGACDMLRTGVALELAAARALAIMAAPVMPRFAARLWSDLGCSPSLEEHGWDPPVAYLQPGTTVRLDHSYFAP